MQLKKSSSTPLSKRVKQDMIRKTLSSAGGCDPSGIVDRSTKRNSNELISSETDKSPRLSSIVSIIRKSLKSSAVMFAAKTFRSLTKLLPIIPVFDPSSNWKLAWDLLIMTISLAYTVVIPLYITFSLSLAYFTTYTCVLASSHLFIADIFINMNTGYFEKGSL